MGWRGEEGQRGGISRDEGLAEGRGRGGGGGFSRGEGFSGDSPSYQRL